MTFVWKTFDTLVFNAETKPDGTGTAYFGHTPFSTKVDTADLYKIKGLRCLPINPPPPGTESYSAFVQKQTITLNKTTGAWDVNKSQIKFAPTSSCDWNATNDASQNATFTVQLEGAPGETTNESLTYPLEHDLGSLADYTASWTGPTAPNASE